MDNITDNSEERFVDESGDDYLIDGFLNDFLKETALDSADQPQFDILYQLRRVIDPQGVISNQEFNIRDGNHNAVYGGNSARGPRVDLSYQTPGRGRINLEVDLNLSSQLNHINDHLAAMRLAYKNWSRNSPRTKKNPLLNVASVFVSANLSRITNVRQFRYCLAPNGRVIQILTGSEVPAVGIALSVIAAYPIFRRLMPIPRGRCAR